MYKEYDTHSTYEGSEVWMKQHVTMAGDSKRIAVDTELQTGRQTLSTCTLQGTKQLFKPNFSFQSLRQDYIHLFIYSGFDCQKITFIYSSFHDDCAVMRFLQQKPVQITRGVVAPECQRHVVEEDTQG